MAKKRAGPAGPTHSVAILAGTYSAASALASLIRRSASAFF